MQVKKAQLEVFFKVLRGTDGLLSLADARVRDAFMKPLGVHVDTMTEDRKKIYELFAKKKEDGTPDTDDGNYHFDKGQIEKVNEELTTFSNEIVEVEFTWGVTASKLKEIMDQTQYKPLYGETEVIDDIIKALDVPVKTKKSK